MSADRRLTKLEGALSPKAATLLWLTELHAFPTLAAYVAWLIDQPASAAPLYRVPVAAEAGVRDALRGEKRVAVDRSVREAVRQAVFLVELVIRLNAAAEEAIQLLGLCCSALSWQLRAITAEVQLDLAGPSHGPRRGHPARQVAWRRAVASLIGDVYLAEESRAHVERRYLDGRLALFPDLAADWLRLRELAERLAGTDDIDASATRVAGARHRPGAASRRSAIDQGQIRASALDRAPEEVASLVDAARAAVLDALGDTDGAATIAGRRVRGERVR